MYRLCSVANPAFLLVLCLVHWTQANNECSFVRSYKKEECVYNIHLTQNDNCDESPPKRHFLRTGYQNDDGFQNDGFQNDVGYKLDSVEKSVSFLKDEHDQRLRDLEGTMKALLGSDLAPSKSYLNLENGAGSKPAQQAQVDSVDHTILTRLHDELGKIRTALKDKTQQLFRAQLEANETTKMFQSTQAEMLGMNQNLADAEAKIAALEGEREALKRQLEERGSELDSSTDRLKECEAKNLEQEEQLKELASSESALAEGLLKCEGLLNSSRDAMAAMGAEQERVTARFARIKQVLGIRERELIDCYGAKTQSFCGFETEHLCGFVQAQDRSDNFDWDWAHAKTPSHRTGPSGDHTCGLGDGHFMFIEASAKPRGRNAIIYSPLYRGMVKQCVEFYYHMYGRHVGTLNVYAKARGAELSSVWRAYGNQGDVWSVARLAIPKRLARAGYQIAFEGITEYGYEGDISIDDVSVTDGDCKQGDVVVVKVAFDASASVVDYDDLEQMTPIERRLAMLQRRFRARRRRIRRIRRSLPDSSENRNHPNNP